MNRTRALTVLTVLNLGTRDLRCYNRSALFTPVAQQLFFVVVASKL